MGVTQGGSQRLLAHNRLSRLQCPLCQVPMKDVRHYDVDDVDRLVLHQCVIRTDGPLETELSGEVPGSSLIPRSNHRETRIRNLGQFRRKLPRKTPGSDQSPSERRITADVNGIASRFPASTSGNPKKTGSLLDSPLISTSLSVVLIMLMTESEHSTHTYVSFLNRH